MGQTVEENKEKKRKFHSTVRYNVQRRVTDFQLHEIAKLTISVPPPCLAPAASAFCAVASHRSW